MFLPQHLRIILYDVAYFGPHMQWQMLLPYVMADVIAIYEYLWQMFVPLLITLVSLLVVSKLADVTALS